MRRPDCFRLVFTLPPVLHLSVLPGRHSPCLHGCVLNVDHDFIASIEGPSRELVFQQTRRFLKVAAKRHGPLSIAAVLSSPAQGRSRPSSATGAPSGRDSWTIIVGADVAFSPTSLPPDLGQPGDRAGSNVVKLVAVRA